MFDMRSVLKNSNKRSAPESWSQLAASYEIQHVWLVNDSNVDRSYVDYIEKIIYVHDDFSYWENYKHPVTGSAQTPEESILLRFLHEVGHIASGHARYGGVRFDAHGNIANDMALMMRENEAWNYATGFKNYQADRFQQMLNSYVPFSH